MNRKNESLRITEDVQCRYRTLQKNGVRLIWELTGRCNLHCRHCFAAVASAGASSARELTTKQAFSVIDQFRELPVAKVMLTGGEVMVRKDLECIVEYMRHKNKDIVIDITTNALLLTDETIKTLQACGIDEISVSLDGPEAVYKNVRGKNADYGKLLHNIQRLCDSGIHVDGIMVLNRLTAETIEETIDLACRLGLSSFTISNLDVLPHSDFDYEGLRLTPEEIEKSLRQIDRLREIYAQKLILRTTGFTGTDCSGKQICTNKNILAINRNGMYCHCLNAYTPEEDFLDSRSVTLGSAFEYFNGRI